MFVEATPNGELVKSIRKMEELNRISDNKRIKFIEKSGRKLINTIRKMIHLERIVLKIVWPVK